jgi:endonuclease YncB( thermonuclease family)
VTLPRVALAAILVITSACRPAGADPIPQPEGAVLTANAVVERVVDGDTITVRLAGGNHTVRLIGIDTPETVDQRRPVQCFGHEASTHTSELLPPGTPVQLVLDAEPRDDYDRLLAYVYRAADGAFVNLDLAAGGYADALSIEPNTAFAMDISAAVADARAAGRGLWGTCGGPDVALDPGAGG